MTRAAAFAALRPFGPGGKIPSADIPYIDALLDRWGYPSEDDPLTVRVAMETLEHEAIVQEAYKDSVGVWTWGVGITNASGIDVSKYKDNPQPISVCLKAYVDRLRKVYIPDVLEAFKGHTLTETQFAAALAFHYNTGAIKRTDWVKLWKAGKVREARQFLETHYLNGGTLAKRRKDEAALFFDGKWSQTGKVSVFPVAKPSYQPRFAKGVRMDVSADLASIL